MLSQGRVQVNWRYSLFFLRILAPYRPVHSWLWLVHNFFGACYVFNSGVQIYILYKNFSFYNKGCKLRYSHISVVDEYLLIFKREMIYPCKFAWAYRWRCVCQTRSRVLWVCLWFLICGYFILTLWYNDKSVYVLTP